MGGQLKTYPVIMLVPIFTLLFIIIGREKKQTNINAIECIFSELVVIKTFDVS